MALNKTILSWKSKVQYKKGTPYISLIKHLSSNLKKGDEIDCKLVMKNDRLKVVIGLD
tara:strand:+ start:22972 stop:23145 length:174 start_codon:yes stop_codon:yes gene_type:complete